MTHHSSRHHRSYATNAVRRILQTPLPPFPPHPSLPMPFIDRSDEVELALQWLSARGVVAITGGQGSGKTALAATIAQHSGLPFTWIELMPELNDRIEPFLWQFARPLAHQTPQLWRALHHMQQAGWAYPPIVRLQVILDGYTQQQEPLLIVIDRIECAQDPALESLLVGLCTYVTKTHATQLRLVVVGTALPARIERYALPTLSGLPVEPLHMWAQHLGLDLSPSDIAGLKEQTDGLPAVVTLVFCALQRQPDRTILQQVVMHPDVRRFITRLLDALPAAASALLRQLSVHPAPQLTSDIVHVLSILEAQHLAYVSKGHIHIHPLIHRFYATSQPTKEMPCSPDQ